MTKPKQHANPDVVLREFQESARRTAELASQLRNRDRSEPKTGELWRTMDGSLILITDVADVDDDGEGQDGDLNVVVLQPGRSTRPPFHTTRIGETGRCYDSSLTCIARVATDFRLYFSGYSL